MEDQTAKNDGQQNDTLLLQMKRPEGNVNHPETNNAKSHEHPDMACKGVFYHCVESEGCVRNEDRNDLDSTVRSKGDGEQPRRSSEAEEEHNMPVLMHSDDVNDIPLLRSMLTKLMNPKGNVDHPKTDNVKSHALSDTACKSVFYHSVEERNNVDRSDGDEKQTMRRSEREERNEAFEEFRGLPDVFPKWERKSALAVSLPIQTKTESEGKSMEVKNNKELRMEENTVQAASNLDGPSLQSSEQMSISLNRTGLAQMEAKHEPLYMACGGPLNPVSMDPSSLLTHRTDLNIKNRTARSASEPVSHRPKEERPLSAPSILNREYDCYVNTMTPKSFNKAAGIFGWEDSGMTEHENLLGKTQKKGVKTKMKLLTQKLMERFKDKQDCEQTGSKGIQDNAEEAAQSMNSVQMKAEAPDIPPPLPPKKGKYVFLERKFTLKDFKLELEPINLMEEIFTENEWLGFLPSKTTPDEKDGSDQSMPSDVLQPEKATSLDVPLPTPELDQSEDMKNNQEDAQQDNVAEINHLKVERLESDASVFAIPKALLLNNVKKHKASGTDCESKKSNNIYDCVDMYIIPKNDFPIMERGSPDDPRLDFSVIKSFELLDNSALKSRIRLSKKRPHRPPKKHKRVKTEKANTKFYKIPPIALNEFPVSLPYHSIPFSTSPLVRPGHS